MKIRTLCVAAAFLVSGCAKDAADLGQTVSVPMQMEDLTDDFAVVHEATQGLEDTARIDAFKQRFASIIPGFYSSERVRFPGYNDLILKALNEYPEKKPEIDDVSRRFGDMLAPAQTSFEKEFGPMTGYAPIVLVHSLGEFDGGMRSLPGGGRLMFGADMIAKLYKKKAIQPFFHHELFHLYHTRSFDDCSAVWCNLWNEGLATYVSHRLNPDATDDELLLTNPVPLRPAVEQNKKEAVCTVLPKLDSTDVQLNNALFSSRRMSERLPPRFGYYLGYAIAAEAAKTASLKELAQLDNNEVRTLVEANLRKLADCS